jgi:hypothetical protein
MFIQYQHQRSQFGWGGVSGFCACPPERLLDSGDVYVGQPGGHIAFGLQLLVRE